MSALEALGVIPGFAQAPAGLPAARTWEQALESGDLRKDEPRDCGSRRAAPDPRDGSGEDAQENQSLRIAESLEALFLADRVWSFGRWQDEILGDPDLGAAARQLVWRFAGEGGGRSGRPEGKDVLDASGGCLSGLTADSEVSLWHPVQVSADETLAWRRALQSLGLRQPCQQVHRAVFVLSEAERRNGTYSNRFAAQILDQKDLLPLCRLRGWSYSLLGLCETFEVPSRTLESWGVIAEFWVAPMSMEDGEGPPFLTTDQLRFRNLDGERLRLDQVPAIVFSEILRDVDHFVSAAGVR